MVGQGSGGWLRRNGQIAAGLNWVLSRGTSWRPLIVTFARPVHRRFGGSRTVRLAVVRCRPPVKLADAGVWFAAAAVRRRRTPRPSLRRVFERDRRRRGRATKLSPVFGSGTGSPSADPDRRLSTYISVRGQTHSSPAPATRTTPSRWWDPPREHRQDNTSTADSERRQPTSPRP